MSTILGQALLEIDLDASLGDKKIVDFEEKSLKSVGKIEAAFKKLGELGNVFGEQSTKGLEDAAKRVEQAAKSASQASAKASKESGDASTKAAKDSSDANQKAAEESAKFWKTGLAEQTETRKALSDKLSRTDIRAPANGIVHALAIHTEGGVIQPGSTLLSHYPPPTEVSPVNGQLPPVGHRRDDLMWPWVGATSGYSVNAPSGVQTMLPDFSAVPGRRIRDVLDIANLGAGLGGYAYF